MHFRWLKVVMVALFTGEWYDPFEKGVFEGIYRTNPLLRVVL